MSNAISLSSAILGRGIASLYDSKEEKASISFVKREILSRALALSTSIFKFIDAVLNFGSGMTTLSFCALKKAGVKKFKGDKYTIQTALSYFKACKKNSLQILTGTPSALYNPKRLIKHHFIKLAPSYSQERENQKIDPFIIDHQDIAKNELKTMSSEEQNRDWHLLKYVGHTRLINLDRDLERLTPAYEHFAKIGLKKDDVERFSAILGKNLSSEIWNRFPDHHNPFMNKLTKLFKKITKNTGFDRWHQAQAGCFMSHYKIIKEAKDNFEKAKTEYANLQKEYLEFQSKTPSLDNDAQKEQIQVIKEKIEAAVEQIKKFSSVLVMEDDNRFGQVIDSQRKETTLTNVGTVFRQVMQELPHDYDMLFFASIVSKKKKWGNMKDILGAKNTRKRLKHVTSERIVKLDYGHATNAYLVHSRFYDTLLNKLKKIEIPGQPLKAVDVEIAELMESSKTYLAVPPLAYQGGFLSSISQRDLPLIQPNKKLWKQIKE